MYAVRLNYSTKSAECDPKDIPVIIVGLTKDLTKLDFSLVKNKLKPRVSEEEWKSAVNYLSQNDMDSIKLYFNRVMVSTLPNKCSRHNAPSRAHAITKILKNASTGLSENILIVCCRDDVYASGCAVARAYPLYNSKTTSATLVDIQNLNSEMPSTKPVVRQVNVEFICTDGKPINQNELETVKNSCLGIQMAARIVDAPCNEMHTDAFLDEVKSLAKTMDVSVTVIRGEELNKKGFGGIYGVGKAAAHPPALAVLSHQPQGASKTIAWVGKGIVFDTGGLSIKGKTQMPGMKRDCGGAAGILGAFYAAVNQGFEENLHAVFCLAENAVSDRSTRPDDILTLYSGRTVEVNNTDAEGRLVLADGVAYARKDLKADIVVDVCTLTGAQGIATGRYHAAHMTNDAFWEDYASKAGRASGDLTFPLVYCPELHFSEFSSAVADMKNSVADRNNAQPSCAGLFINSNLGFDFPGVWLHIDMAAPSHCGERATGYGVAILNTLFGNHVKSNLLQRLCPLDNGNADVSSGNKKIRLQ